MDENYTGRALTALSEAAGAEQDFGGWLAGVLARIAGREDEYLVNCEPLFSPADLRTARPGTDRPLPG